MPRVVEQHSEEGPWVRASSSLHELREGDGVLGHVGGEIRVLEEHVADLYDGSSSRQLSHPYINAISEDLPAK